MEKRKINKVKKAIKKEIALEVRAIKILAPIFGGAVVMLAGLYSLGILWVGFLG